jgi:hypothetical protein
MRKERGKGGEWMNGGMGECECEEGRIRWRDQNSREERGRSENINNKLVPDLSTALVLGSPTY